MKRDEGGELRLPEELVDSSFDDLTVGLTDVTITRSRAIKLAGAALAGSALTLLWPGEADARNKKRRRRKRRRRRAQVTQQAPVSPASIVPIPDTDLFTAPVVFDVTNPSDKPLTINDVKVVDGEGLADASLLNGESVTIAPGDTGQVTVNLTISDPLVDAGSLQFIAGNGLPVTVVDENGDVVGDGDIDLAFDVA